MSTPLRDAAKQLQFATFRIYKWIFFIHLMWARLTRPRPLVLCEGVYPKHKHIFLYFNSLFPSTLLKTEVLKQHFYDNTCWESKTAISIIFFFSCIDLLKHSWVCLFVSGLLLNYQEWDRLLIEWSCSFIEVNAPTGLCQKTCKWHEKLSELFTGLHRSR